MVVEPPTEKVKTKNKEKLTVIFNSNSFCINLTSQI